MSKNNSKKNSSPRKGQDAPSLLPAFAKAYFMALLMVFLAAIVGFSFFDLAGTGGESLFDFLAFLFGRAVFLLPLFLLLAGLIFFVAASAFNKVWRLVLLATLACLLGLSSILASFSFGGEFLWKTPGFGGVLGQLLGFLVLKLFGFWVNLVFFGAVLSFGFLVFWKMAERAKPQNAEDLAEKPSLVRKIFEPKLRVREVPSGAINNNGRREEARVSQPPELKTKPILQGAKGLVYNKPSLELLELEHGTPTTGDIRNNSAIIKKSLETFGIPVEMGEVNIGPTVTQYTLKPAEGIKLAKITTLGNDLSLALAVHPIRIEAPIPGKALVGIELPNKSRTQVKLRNLFESNDFKNSTAPLLFALGRDVAGNPLFADLGRMPHLLVAGATGTGKTICLNSIIVSLIFRNSPEMMRLILVDPKRVEFPVYEDLPHLLSPVIFDSQKTINTLKWLVKEMERRFEVLAQAKARDITSFNRDVAARQQKASNEAEMEDLEFMPYIVVVIDELADLMAARGKEVEGGIVRLAQMARAVGIHLIVATQRPSVEVITGLIKANITSRISFQVASQVDSRTVLDMAGAEKLLGAGDLLFISAETSRPRRIQGAYVSDKEVRRVIDFLKGQKEDFATGKEGFLAAELERELEVQPGDLSVEQFLSEEDPLYLSAKQLVIESKKASASLLQRRLRVGYARAARLLDILQERGVIGPGEGAKPREVFIQGTPPLVDLPPDEGVSIPVKRPEEENDDWEKV